MVLKDNIKAYKSAIQFIIAHHDAETHQTICYLWIVHRNKNFLIICHVIVRHHITIT